MDDDFNFNDLRVSSGLWWQKLLSDFLIEVVQFLEQERNDGPNCKPQTKQNI